MFTHLQQVSEGQTSQDKKSRGVSAHRFSSPRPNTEQEEEFMTSKTRELEVRTSPGAGRLK